MWSRLWYDCDADKTCPALYTSHSTLLTGQVQNTEGEDIGVWQVIQDLYREGGIGAFFDGLTPKMLRAAVNHAVTFFVYDLILGVVGAGAAIAAS